jgi:hypothetical protein
MNITKKTVSTVKPTTPITTPIMRGKLEEEELEVVVVLGVTVVGFGLKEFVWKVKLPLATVDFTIM